MASDCCETWHLVPRGVIEHATGPVLAHAAPLLKEKRDAASQALVADVPHPLRLHGPGTGP